MNKKRKPIRGQTCLYITVEVSPEQLREITKGLEEGNTIGICVESVDRPIELIFTNKLIERKVSCNKTVTEKDQ